MEANLPFTEPLIGIFGIFGIFIEGAASTKLPALLPVSLWCFSPGAQHRITEVQSALSQHAPASKLSSFWGIHGSLLDTRLKDRFVQSYAKSSGVTAVDIQC
jgi:hypothetical protein